MIAKIVKVLARISGNLPFVLNLITEILDVAEVIAKKTKSVKDDTIVEDLRTAVTQIKKVKAKLQ